MSVGTRVGVIAGFAVGYYLGTKAGRERYEQIRRSIQNARQSRLVEQAQAAVKRGIDNIPEPTEPMADWSTPTAPPPPRSAG